MTLKRRRPTRVLVLICAAAALAGITGAFAADRIEIEPARATQGYCTHYSHPYGQYSGSPWQCYEYVTHNGPFKVTTSTAIRDVNAIAFNTGNYDWAIWYRNGDDTYNCCWNGALNTTGGSSGASNGYAKAVCDPEDNLDGFGMYCTTWW